MTQPRASILAIDDKPANLITPSCALDGEFDLQIATADATGQTRARKNPPDLILLGVMVPKFPGWIVMRNVAASRRPHFCNTFLSI